MLIFLFICFPILYYWVCKRNNVLSHCSVFILAITFSDFAKRAIYSYGIDLNEWYYPITLLPDTVFFCILLLSFPRVNLKRFLFVMLFNSSIIAYSVWQNDLSAIFANVKTVYWYLTILILPSKYFNITLDGIRDYYRLFLGLCFIAGGYGLMQFFFGYFRYELNWFAFSPTKMGFLGVTRSGESI